VGDSAMDVYEQDGALFVEVGLPGVAHRDLSVSARGSQLLIWARRRPRTGERRYRVRGIRGPGVFSHDLTVPPEGRLDRATASYVHGLLRVRIPLAREDEVGERPIPVDA